jgi:F420-dependent oxidoreductase-like protein
VIRLGFTLPYGESAHRRALTDYGRLAEEGGYESFWVPEAWGSDAVSLLGALAATTTRIQLATGIINIFSRGPSLIAQTFATLDELSGGRMIIGLGTSGPQVIERWHGTRFDRPIQRMREVVEIVRLALAGERVNYDGKVFTLSGFKLGMDPPRPRIPIYLATFKSQGLRLTGEIADGWLPTNLSMARLPTMLKTLEEGARAAGRDPKAIDVAAMVLTAASDNGEEARMLARRHLAYYVGGMGTFYYELTRSCGFSEEADRIRERWATGDRDGAARQVSDAMVDSLSITGTTSECQKGIEARLAAGIAMPVLFPPHGASIEMVKGTLKALAPRAF